MNKTKSIFRFKGFPVYKDTRILRSELRKLSKQKFPKDEKFCLTSQLWRAVDSILLNIAEGSERYNDLDFSKFLNNALTSVNEVVAILDAAFDDGYINKKELNLYTNGCKNIYKQLRAFSAKVRNDNKRKGRSVRKFMTS